MSTIYEYYMWQDLNSTTTTTTTDLVYDRLDIQLYFHHVLELHYPENIEIPLITTHKSFPILRDQNFSLNDHSRSSVIDSILSTTGAARDFINSLLPEVSSFAMEMVAHPCNSNVKVLTMGLIIYAVTTLDEHEVIDLVLSETIQENARFKPASKFCIEGLQRFRIMDDNGGVLNETCMVCLEKESVGEEAIRLLCGHVFHGDCIVKWLETSHLCPLCRFAVS